MSVGLLVSALDALAHAELLSKQPDPVYPFVAGPDLGTPGIDDADRSITLAFPERFDGLPDERCRRVGVQLILLVPGMFDELVHGPARALGQFIARLEDNVHLDVGSEDEELQCRVARLRETGVLDSCGTEVWFEHGPEVGVEQERRISLEHSAVQKEQCHLVLARSHGKLVLLAVSHDDDLGHRHIGFGGDEGEVTESDRAVSELAVEGRDDRESFVHEEPRGAGCWRGTEDCRRVQQMALLWRDFLRKSRQREFAILVVVE